MESGEWVRASSFVDPATLRHEIAEPEGSPERRLVSAVLAQAVIDAFEGVRGTKTWWQHDRVTLGWLAEVLDLDPNRLRRIVLARLDQNTGRKT